MTTVVARRLLISGHVQGVFFRQSTQNQARRLGLSGWVRNLPDGRVEAKVWGDAEAVNALAHWCHTGPANALVTDVSVEDSAPEPGVTGFRIR
ncbi:MAG: acylphosphatase [Chloroflexi bacterium]|nr:acylphosphatase [Chloroflexota bacterium]